MIRSSFLRTAGMAVAAAAALAATPASAVSILVSPRVAPNAFGSPFYQAWVSNTMMGMRSGDLAVSIPDFPSYSARTENVMANQVIVTGFNSWMGRVDPGAAFGALFAGEWLFRRWRFGAEATR